MIVLRGLAFLFFLLLAAAIVLWQVHHLMLDVNAAWSSGAALTMMVLGAGILATEIIVVRAFAKKLTPGLLSVTGLPVLPLTGALAGLISLLQLKTGDHKQIWRTAQGIGTLATLNLLVPLAVGGVLLGGSPGLSAGWTAIKFQFFLVVDYFLCRSILHYFSSGASTFVSLRFLRKRVLSLLAVFGIMLGVVVLILVNSVMTGFQTDFREQMRGSLSHILVRFRSDDIQMRMRMDTLREAEWAHYVKRIEADESMLPDWQRALENALELYRAADKDGLPDPADFARMQPPPPVEGDNPDKPDPGESDTGDEDAFIQRLRTGKGLTDFDRECLRDDGKIVSPKEFFLSRVGDPKKLEQEIHLEWYGPLFREALQEEFDRAEEALNEHTDPGGKHDVTGVSWRLSTKTFITPKSGSRELPIAELVGVDAAREPHISNLGEYVASAELTEFRDQYVLGPMLNILGATLGWETAESVEATEARREFMFTEDAKGTGRFPDDMTHTLALRRFTTATGRVRWREFDNVRYLEFSPGRRLYERVRESYKAASRTEDLKELGEILKACEADVRAILLEQMKDESPSERFQQVNYQGARIIFAEYLTGSGPSIGAISMVYTDNTLTLKNFAAEPDTPPGDVELANKIWDQINAATQEADKEVRRKDLTEAQREDALTALGQKYLAIYDAGIKEAEAGTLDRALDLFQNLRAGIANPEDLLPLRKRMGVRRKVPMAYAVENFDAQAEAVRARMQAYRKVLPVRTSMIPGESIEDYTKRATTPGMRPDDDKPGIILGDALAETALGAGVNIGDSIAVTIPRIYFEDNRMVPRTIEVWFKVTGFFRSGLYEENRGRMYCDFEELTKLLADSEIRYVVGARLADYRPYEGQNESDKLKDDLRQAMRDHRVHAVSVGVWEDETRTLLEAVNIERSLIGLIVSFIIVLAGGAIVIIVYQLVNEKVKDIGILKALGHSPWGIRSVFMFNALFIGLFGAVLGAGAGMVASEYLNQIEDFIDEMTGIRLFPPDVYFLTYIPSVKGFDLLMLAVDVAAPVVMFGFFCGILPSMAAARKDPVEALHYE
ncbi:MAG: FtsX-like permease family protein [Planctomycetes bacterium]|nr:FtsX-like permease family protein [Planctomycetota bacterium]